MELTKRSRSPFETSRGGRHFKNTKKMKNNRQYKFSAEAAFMALIAAIMLILVTALQAHGVLPR